LTSPRFDTKAVKRVRQQMLSLIARQQEEPRAVASKLWFQMAFPGHSYGQPELGTAESLDRISGQDLKNFARSHFARNNLIVGVVGDIDAATLTTLLDETFGALPGMAEVNYPEDVTAAPEPGIHVVRTTSPQSVVLFGEAGIKRRDPDWYVAYVMNYILGGGGLTSRLMEEVREKRGLAYGVYTSLSPLDHAGLILGNVGSENARIGETIKVIRDEITRLRDHGVTADELKNAITYLTGSYPLQFSSSGDIALQLMMMQLDGFDTDYVNQRNGYISSVTAPQIERVAKRLLQPDGLSWVVVGDPQGLPDLAPAPVSAPSKP
jgi:zinc protease